MSQSANEKASETYFEQALRYTSRLARLHAERKLTVARMRYFDQWGPAFDELRANRAAHSEEHELCVQLLNAAVRQVDASVRSRCLDDMRALLPLLTEIFAWWQPEEIPLGGMFPLEELADGTRRYCVGGSSKLHQAIQHLEALSYTFEQRVRAFAVMWGGWQTTEDAGGDTKDKDKAAPDKSTDKPKRPKRSTQPGEARAKIIAALTQHHRYTAGEALNFEPIANNALADLADVDKSTVSAFIATNFEDRDGYLRACHLRTFLTTSLRIWNDHFTPRELMTTLTQLENMSQE